MIDGIGSHDAAQPTQWNRTDTVETRAAPTSDSAYNPHSRLAKGFRDRPPATLIVTAADIGLVQTAPTGAGR
ncbi:MAG: hypothetical protein WA979_10410 [Pacificimonas sp.]